MRAQGEVVALAIRLGEDRRGGVGAIGRREGRRRGTWVHHLGDGEALATRRIDGGVAPRQAVQPDEAVRELSAWMLDIVPECTTSR